jgi:transcription antitermination protein NusB
MLNRRSLRIKAMQSLFAYQLCTESNLEISKDYIKEYFQPDLNTMEPQDKQQLKAKTKEALGIFDSSYKDKVVKSGADASTEIINVVSKAIELYYKSNKKDLEYLQKQMLINVDQLADMYILLLMLVVEMAEHSESYLQEQNLKYMAKDKPVVDSHYNFARNKMVAKLKNHKEINLRSIKSGNHWSGQESHLRTWYKEVFLKNEEFMAYLSESEPSFERDKEIVLFIIKQLFLKDPFIVGWFDDHNQNWEENKKIVKSMVIKTIKGIEENSPEDEPALMELSANWEEDRDFFKEIFSITHDNDEEYEEIIAGQSKNWDISRIALVDKIILKMALAEMIHFHSIPVKVTINEFIEVSKNYGTPKTKIFVNGILDVLANKLTSEGVIKKSGRGLIDNK